MDDMNQTQEPTTEAGQHSDQPRSQGPRVTRDEVFDIERLRRSSTDKYVAGVSGGLGRHLDVDPLIVRVVFAVSALFGVGILLYGALWLLLPDDEDRAPVDTNPETRKVLVILAAVLAAAMLMGGIFGDGWGIFPVALLALAGVATWAAVRNKDSRPAPPAGQDPDRYRRDRETLPAAAAPDGSDGPDGPAGPGIAWRDTPPPAGRPRRTGPILFWPTLAVLAIALGSLAMYDLDHPVAHGAYAALSLAVVGVALVIGAFVGRGGGLILVGLLAVPPLLVTTTIGNDFTSSTGQVTDRPTLASQVQDEYDVRSGQLRLDLTGLPATELAQLDGREIEIDMTAGEVVVTLPEGVGSTVQAELFAGEIRAFDRVSNGVNADLTSTSPASAGGPTIDFEIDGSVGRIEVNQEGTIR